METNHTVPRERYDRLVREAQCSPPVITAVVHPCDQISIEGVVEAAKLGLIAPILVGPPARIRDAAQQLMKGSLHTDELMGRSSRARPGYVPRGGSAIVSSWMFPAIRTR